jgi:Zn-dependent M28 family amino/carboxypeptidase
MSRLSPLATADNDRRREEIVRQMRAAGLEPDIETFVGGRMDAPETGYNIVASFGPEAGSEILMVAHYDAIQLKDGAVEGIVDNAASVVAMIEAARRLEARPPGRRVRVLFTDQEELGLLGARAWIGKHGVERVAAVVNADVAAYGETLMYGTDTGVQSKPVWDALGRVCAARAMSCYGMAAYPPSDDVAFAQAGAPVVSIGFQPAAEAVKLDRFMQLTERGGRPSPTDIPEVLALIHTPNDVLAKADSATITTAADTFEALVRELDASLP